MEIRDNFISHRNQFEMFIDFCKSNIKVESINLGTGEIKYKLENGLNVDKDIPAYLLHALKLTGAKYLLCSRRWGVVDAPLVFVSATLESSGLGVSGSSKSVFYFNRDKELKEVPDARGVEFIKLTDRWFILNQE